MMWKTGGLRVPPHCPRHADPWAVTLGRALPSVDELSCHLQAGCFLQTNGHRAVHRTKTEAKQKRLVGRT